MQTRDQARKSDASAVAAGEAGRGFGAGTLALAAVAGLIAGTAGTYFVASAQFADESAAISQADDLRVQAANDHVAQLQEQLRSVEEQSARQQQQLVEEAKAQQSRVVRQLSEQQRAVEQQQNAVVEQARERERDLAKPDLPLRVWVHRPLLGRGLVASMHNFGTKEITLTVTARRSAAPQGETWTTVIAANASQLLGGDTGLQFRAGDTIELASADYRPMSFQVPQRARPPGSAVSAGQSGN